MFISKKDQVIIPQSEHARLAAIIASLWGNKELQKPNLPEQSFINDGNYSASY